MLTEDVGILNYITKQNSNHYVKTSNETVLILQLVSQNYKSHFNIKK